MKKRKKVRRAKVILLILLVSVPLLGQVDDFGISFLSPKSFYVYAMGSWLFNAPTGYYSRWEGRPGTDSTIAPLIGIGYWLVKAGNRFLIGMEFDYTEAEVDIHAAGGKQIDIYTFMVNVEYRWSARARFSFYAGFGFSWIDYSHGQVVFFNDYFDFSEDLEYRVPICFGVKYDLTRHLLLRVDLRSYAGGVGGDGYYYSLDDFGSSSYLLSERRLFAGALSVGFEYRF
ncbi:MAG: hypothetical protein KAW12_16550 [Candidatus Aminicenantes bacterium]|nr:hypothetical protein [Candidatus Aminicenantes bacterium]